ncbi:MAG: glycosyltransferase family 2 protein [Leptolyngbya sp. SIO4C5]|nr:glycosyltransferase family 2 protein [Leptolyngbya sp. SIO4C5]
MGQTTNPSSQRQQPLVSVVIPAYNAALFIEKTLVSVLSQTYPNFEVLVVDDGSQDATAAIVLHLAQQDARIRLIQQRNSGVAAARNTAIRQAQGEFIAPIDADDLWRPENLARQVEVMQAGGESVGLVYSWSVDIDENDLPTGEFRAAQIEGQTLATLTCHNFIGNASASMIRRACLEKLGDYNTQLHALKAQGCEDWDLYLRIAEHYEFRVVPEFLVGYRKLSQGMSGDLGKMAASHQKVMQDLRQRSPQMPAFLCRLSSSSFYIYLSRQGYQYGNYRSALFWLKQALKAECITPPLRLGLYPLGLYSLWASTQPPNQKTAQQAPKTTQKLTTQVPFQSAKADWQYIKSFSLSLKLTVGSALHYLLKTLYHRKPSTSTYAVSN